MSRERDRPRQPPVAKGSTRTDLRMTREPADTPRGRLFRLAAIGVRTGQEIQRRVELGRDDMARARALAKRGIELLKLDESRGARLVVKICADLDQALGVLAMVGAVDIFAVSDALTTMLMRVEVAESTIRDLQEQLETANRDLKFERGHNEELRRSLAAEQARAAAAIRDEPAETWNADAMRDVPAETWEEETRNSNLSEKDIRALSDPNLRVVEE